MDLICMSSPDGLYFGNNKIGYRGREPIAFGAYRINGGTAPVTKTFKEGWYLLEGVAGITLVERSCQGKYHSPRWVLRDVSVATEGKIPLTISVEDACEQGDCGEYWFGKESQYASISGLYERVRDKEDNSWESIPFTCINKGHINSVNKEDYTKAVHVLTKEATSTTEATYSTVNLEDIVNYAELEEMLTPDLVIHTRPCYIGREAAYRIIRSHIKANIVGQYARLTTDYDFCLAVTKVVKVKAFTTTHEKKKANGRSYASPRISTRHHDKKEVLCFEMAPKAYQKYPVIAQFQGENLRDLAENVKLYLEELMTHINAPLEECQHCGGVGMIMDNTFDMNKR